MHIFNILDQQLQSNTLNPDTTMQLLAICLATIQFVLEWRHGEGNLRPLKANNGITGIYKLNHLSGFQRVRGKIWWAGSSCVKENALLMS